MVLKRSKKFFEKLFLLIALTSLLSLFGIVYFLFSEGTPIFRVVSFFNFIFGVDWYPTETPPAFGILSLIVGSLVVTILSGLIAIPLGVMTAAYLSEIASARVRSIVKPFIELLAALPSVVIGFIGMVVIAPFLQNVFGAPTGLNLVNASLLLAFMAVPTICSITEDAFQGVPRALKEASLALGATRWETMRKITFPGAFSGTATAVMLGMSRSIGETMVVLMVAGGAAIIPEDLFDPVRPMPASIVAEMAEAPFRSEHYFALFATGIVLFVFTFLFNVVAFHISEKYKLKVQTGA
ncbi:MAG: phosphate ABC transporter permease subunit PstC [Burkholderiaceae bacterium]|nr:phosphate ABC transporter permease subunit PstC [Burkholderiaceae bacterium]